MNLRYYLRGLGIGVVVTAVIMSITMGGRTENLSNAEVKERARALGMVEPTGVLAELQGEGETEDEPQQGGFNTVTAEPAISPSTEPVVSPEASAEPSEEPEATAESHSPEPEASAEPEASPTSRPTATPEESPSASPAAGGEMTDTTVIIVVRSGESSYTICQKLEDAGIVASASAFDSFLCSRGYDTKLRTGTFEIPLNAQPEEIARILVPGS